MRFRFLNFSWPVSVILLVIACLAAALLISIAIAALISRPALSSDVLKYFDRDLVLKSFDYNRTSLLISVASKILQWSYFSLAVFLVIRFFSKAGMRLPVLISYIVLFFIVMYIVLLPLSYFRGFIIEHSYGLSNQTVSAWFLDYLKDSSINIALFTVVLTVVDLLVVYTPRYWYLVAFAVLVAFIFIMTVLYPLVIDPLFYDFKPLEEGSLKDRISDVTQKADIEVKTILVADASRRTTRANAYFTGLGPSKRIVLYDNLVDGFSEDEVVNVVAHEAGHSKSLHIFKSLMLGILGGAVLLVLVKFMVDKYSNQNNLLLILTIFIFFTLSSFITQPVQNAISRDFEREADRLTIEFTGDAETQVSLFRNLAVKNLSNVKPNRYIKYLLYSHPPIIERIGTVLDTSR